MVKKTHLDAPTQAFIIHYGEPEEVNRLIDSHEIHPNNHSMVLSHLKIMEDDNRIGHFVHDNALPRDAQRMIAMSLPHWTTTMLINKKTKIDKDIPHILASDHKYEELHTLAKFHPEHKELVNGLVDEAKKRGTYKVRQWS